MSERQTLVLIPGFMGQESDFDALINALPKTIQPIVLPLPPVNDGPEVFDAGIAHWFYDIRKQLPEHFYLFGYSLGGRIAMALVSLLKKNEPKTVQGLFLESAHPGLETDDERKARLHHDRQWAYAFECESLQEVLLRWYKQPVFSDVSLEQQRTLIHSKKNMSGKYLARQLMHFSLGTQPNYRECLRHAACPVYYFSGRDDKKFTDIGTGLRGINSIVVEGCGHNIHFQNPAWMAGEISKILSEQEIL
ncbi:alpha/beta fold hydrolase [Teredinibacter haidensis]|uniref:alpha/beta fold hydrolase n=1 Tax=Teredinibacter haidensis TaxID=2731755 RepID=UPI000948B0DA|nr:alpha/beta fold hydrolase [Teredinibacter haidensis]